MALRWYRQAELVHARWAMLGAAGVLVQELVKPEVFFYEAGLPQNLPAPFTNVNMGGLLAWQFILMHWVEVRRCVRVMRAQRCAACTHGHLARRQMMSLSTRTHGSEDVHSSEPASCACILFDHGHVA